jgi:hypothetical protein
LKEVANGIENKQTETTMDKGYSSAEPYFVVSEERTAVATDRGRGGAQAKYEKVDSGQEQPLARTPESEEKGISGLQVLGIFLGCSVPDDFGVGRNDWCSSICG